MLGALAYRLLAGPPEPRRAATADEVGAVHARGGWPTCGPSDRVGARGLSGYDGAHPVRIGNGAFDQRQNDVFGAALDSVLLHSRHSQRIPRRLWPLVQEQAECATAVWRQPDQVIWEARGEPRHYVSSKLMCWVALDRAARLANIRGEAALRSAGQRLPRSQVGHPRSWGRQSRRAVNTPTTDCPARRGSFLVCSFWLVSALAIIGETQRARHLMERLVKAASPLGLYAEEFDAKTGRHLGNSRRPSRTSH